MSFKSRFYCIFDFLLTLTFFRLYVDEFGDRLHVMNTHFNKDVHVFSRARRNLVTVDISGRWIGGNGNDDQEKEPVSWTQFMNNLP